MSDEGTKCRAQFAISCYFRSKSSQCWINVESGSDVSQVGVVQLWDVSSRLLTKVC